MPIKKMPHRTAVNTKRTSELNLNKNKETVHKTNTAVNESRSNEEAIFKRHSSKQINFNTEKPGNKVAKHNRAQTKDYKTY